MGRVHGRESLRLRHSRATFTKEDYKESKLRPMCVQSVCYWGNTKNLPYCGPMGEKWPSGEDKCGAPCRECKCCDKTWDYAGYDRRHSHCALISDLCSLISPPS